MTNLRILNLYSGIGGLDLAAEAAGINGIIANNNKEEEK